MIPIPPRLLVPLTLLLAVAWPRTVAGQGTPNPETRVVILGTGTPNADPDRWGPAVAVVVGDRAYLVDAGVGIVRRAAAAARAGTTALRAANLDRVFLTHLHSDHTLGLPDLMFSPWVLEREVPLEVYGPSGTAEMAAHIEAAWSADIENRLGGLEPQTTRNYRAVVHEIAGGIVYRDSLVTVEAVPVPHGLWSESFAFRFTTADKVIVVSGDATPADAIVDACAGCDILVHEVYSAEAFKRREPEWQRYHAASHTSTVELAALARRARPDLLVLYHQLYWGSTDADLVREVAEAGYTGRVVSAADLDVFR